MKPKKIKIPKTQWVGLFKKPVWYKVQGTNSLVTGPRPTWIVGLPGTWYKVQGTHSLVTGPRPTWNVVQVQSTNSLSSDRPWNVVQIHY